MIGNRIKPILMLCRCLGLLLIAIGCTLVNSYPNSLAPARSLTLTIDKSQREDLFGQLRKFTEKHGFDYEITDFNTNGERFQFWMSRDDIFITASDVPPDPSLVYMLFYEYPGATVGEDVVDELLNDLKDLVSEIPNVMISEEKQYK